MTKSKWYAVKMVMTRGQFLGWVYTGAFLSGCLGECIGMMVQHYKLTGTWW